MGGGRTEEIFCCKKGDIRCKGEHILLSCKK